MNPDDLLRFFSLLTVSLGIKIFLLTLLFFYTVFALVAWRQAQLMSEILNLLNFSPVLRLVAAVHFLAAIAIFILTLFLFVLF